MTEKPFQFDSARFMDANRDYVQRIEREGLIAVYDATLDTLFIEIGGTREAITDPSIDNVMIRIDPDTLEIVGLEIHDFLNDFVPANRLVRELIKDWPLDGGKDAEATLMPPGITVAARALTQLAFSRVVDAA